MNEKAVVLIDGGYLDKVRLAFGRPQLDLIAFSNKVCYPHIRHRTYYYDALPWVGQSPSQADVDRKRVKQQYLDSLRLLDHFEVRLGEVQRNEISCPRGGSHVVFVQKLVDVLLSVDLVWLAWSKHVDIIVLVSGDRDFLPAVETAKKSGVIAKLVYAKPPQGFVHTNLLMACDERQIINQQLITSCLKNTATE